MAKASEWPDVALAAMANAWLASADHGWLYILSGTKPGRNSALSGNTILHKSRLGTPAGPTATNGHVVLAGLSTELTLASGTASFVRIYDTTETTCLYQGTVSITAGDGNFVLPSLTIASGVSWSAGSVEFDIAATTSGV